MKKNGFTLIELLAVIGMIVILAAMIVPAFKKSNDKVHNAPAKSAVQTTPSKPDNCPLTVVIDGHEYLHSPTCNNPDHFKVF